MTTRRSFASVLVALVVLGTTSLVNTGLVNLTRAQDTAPAVTEIVTARGYARETGASEPTTSFGHNSGNVFVVIRLENPTSTEQDIHVSFERDEGEPSARSEPGGMTLHVPASRRYRTVARGTTNRPAGAYRAVVRSDAGEVLSSVDFTITE